MPLKPQYFVILFYLGTYRGICIDTKMAAVDSWLYSINWVIIMLPTELHGQVNIFLSLCEWCPIWLHVVITNHVFLSSLCFICHGNSCFFAPQLKHRKEGHLLAVTRKFIWNNKTCTQKSFHLGVLVYYVLTWQHLSSRILFRSMCWCILISRLLFLDKHAAVPSNKSWDDEGARIIQSERECMMNGFCRRKTSWNGYR
jgi:hypothetical protein